MNSALKKKKVSSPHPPQKLCKPQKIWEEESGFWKLRHLKPEGCSELTPRNPPQYQTWWWVSNYLATFCFYHSCRTIRPTLRERTDISRSTKRLPFTEFQWYIQNTPQSQDCGDIIGLLTRSSLTNRFCNGCFRCSSFLRSTTAISFCSTILLGRLSICPKKKKDLYYLFDIYLVIFYGLVEHKTVKNIMHWAFCASKVEI